MNMHEPIHSLAVHMEAIAEELLGSPNARLSSDGERRYGKHGSLSIDVATGRYYDHESKTGGGVLDLISRETGRDHKAAMQWMREHGYLEQRERPPQQLGKEVAHYSYTDENDELLFQVVRFEPKTFRQRRRPHPGDPPDKIKHGWVYAVRGIRYVPYRLPELMEAIANGQVVYVVEGEKDADNLSKIGFVATTNPGGVGKWSESHTAFFRDADVVIIPHNDPQARNPDPPNGDGALRFHPDGRPVLPGQDHAQDVAKSLSGTAQRVRVLDLARHWPDMPPKGDVSDWLKAGGTPDALHALADATPDWSAVPFRSRFGGLRWEEIAISGHASGYTWVVEDIIPMDEIILIYGDSGSGKSFGTFDLGMAVARGQTFIGRNTEPGLVVYVAAEAGKGFSKRKLAYVIQHELPHKATLPFYLCTKRPDFFGSDDDLVALIAEIEAVAKTYNVPLVLIILDTLSALAPGMNENASQDVSIVRKRLVALQQRFGAAVILVHHKPKGGGSPRGHSSLTADFETTIEFEIVADRRTSKGGSIHRATVRKQREGKSGIRWEFTLPVISVGRNKWGNEETSCAAVAYDATESAERTGYQATSNERLLMHALFDAINDYGVPPPFPLPASVSKVVDVGYVRAAMRAKFVDDDTDTEAADNRFRGAFKRAGDKLRDAKIIGIQKPYWWWTGKPVAAMGG
ncbi:AAA family ATPase [Bradyrhizobium septentrionale]|uniref:AAA family ATPase n=1 Tax=Bradyrhizobium septentrionale TaxID=1404411 RepID=A0A974A1D6_9BRAD|nr:AAA family ATPase [Bradyrhizobium septentrionale]UGY13778.1 AAA family ATPase [Bradyrhizobium septentrionale]